MRLERLSLFAATLALMGAGCLQAKAEITNFEQCAAAGYPVMESYPRQCRADGKTFVEKVAPTPTPEPTPTGGNGGSQTLVQLGESFTLKIGQFRTVQGGLNVTLLEIGDSRCPKDVQCIWAGELNPKLRIEMPDQQDASAELTLGTTTKPKADGLGYHFVLENASESEATLTVTK